MVAMNYSLIAAFDYEIKNNIQIELNKTVNNGNGKKEDFFNNISLWKIKRYLEKRIKQLKQEIKDSETKLLNGSDFKETRNN